MDGRIKDEDGDDLNPFFTTSPPRPTAQQPPYSSSSQNFAFSPPDHFPQLDDVFTAPPTTTTANSDRLNADEGDDDDQPTSASTSQNYQYAPKVFDRFDSSSTSSDDNDEFHYSDARHDAVRKRLDYMMDYLDRKLSMSANHPADVGEVGQSQSPDQSQSQRHPQTRQPLPEFIATGGGTGIFKRPVRSAVNPVRPPSLEVRPHPLREKQIGRFLRNITCIDDGRQMWAGSECGLRAWDLGNIYGAGVAKGEEEEEYYDVDEEWGELEGLVEEDTAPYVESVRTVGALCVVGDDGNRLVWSGHKDGKIRCWKMDGINNNSRGRFKEGLSWQAHRGPVLSMVMTSHGKLGIMIVTFEILLFLGNCNWII